MSRSETYSKLVVVGANMMDFTSYAARLPKEGETLIGTKFTTSFGGKAANQCVLAAKLGGSTAFVTRIGEDDNGKKTLGNLESFKVNTKHVLNTKGFITAISQLIVAETGQNQVVYVPEANKKLCPSDIDSCRETIENADVLVCTLEISPETVIRALEIHSDKGKTNISSKKVSILNAAPALDNLDPKLLKLPTIFCVNETEASVSTKLPVRNKSEAIVAIDCLLKKGCQSVVLTLGSEGVLYASQEKPNPVHVNCPKVNCVDSTGAGDAFIGALAYLLGYRKDLDFLDMLKAACFVASDSVTKVGTQTSYAGPELLEEYFN